jgi:hypothetical protein
MTASVPQILLAIGIPQDSVQRYDEMLDLVKKRIEATVPGGLQGRGSLPQMSQRLAIFPCSNPAKWIVEPADLFYVPNDPISAEDYFIDIDYSQIADEDKKMTKVKKLEWHELKLGGANAFAAQTAIGHFEIHKGTDRRGKDWITALFYPSFSARPDEILHPNVKRLATAKKRCQEYFENLVYQCLEIEAIPER